MTIKDIARIANVSVATVSRILNHKDQHISQETRERVLQIIKDCGYVPYAKLRDRLLSDNNTIGLAVPTLETWFHASFVAHVQTLARQNGYALSLAVTGGTLQEELFALESLRSIKAEGVLLFPGSREGLQMLERLHDEGCASVILDYMIENAVCPQVFRVNDRIAKRCAELLLENCQRIALVLRKECGKIAGNSIRSGFEAALLEANHPVDPSLEVHVVPEFEETFDALLESGVDGIVCQDAEIAGLVYAAAGKRHLQIPEDLSVVAMEDAPVSMQLIPPLTSGNADPKIMAEAAMEALIWQMQDKNPKFTSQTVFCNAKMRGSIATKQKHTPRIAIIGSMNTDVVLHVPHLPRPGETMLTPQITTWFGGKGANQALGVSRMGGNAYLVGCLGNDRYGKQIFEQLSDAKVNMAGVTLTSEFPTGTAYINVCPDGDSTIVVHPGANSMVDQDYIRRHQTLLRSADYCLIQMELPFDAVQQTVSLCQKIGTKVVLKPSPAQTIPDELLNGLFMLVPNEEEADVLCPNLQTPEEKATFLLHKGVQNVIITLGAEGCLWANCNEMKRFPAHPYPCVDTTGASDVFISCLAVMLTENNSIETAIHAASWASSYSVSCEGVQSSIPERVLLNEFLRDAQI